VLAPEIATGDGALGFWQALREVWPSTRQQRCWVHTTANVLNALPKSLHGKAKQDLHAISEAENRKEAEAAFDRFVTKYGAKYDKAAACLAKDRVALLTFYDFPAEHRKHVRTSNPIESTFATVRLRVSVSRMPRRLFGGPFRRLGRPRWRAASSTGGARRGACSGGPWPCGR
jgi:transposase-like protein